MRTVLLALLGLAVAAAPAVAQQGRQGQVTRPPPPPLSSSGADPNCADTGNNAGNNAGATANQNCADGKQNPQGRDTSKGGNMGQRRNPGR